jgi:2-amino-4-hydroxy-6-hydroxymethyldihydropteridine diphosphokinase
MCKDMKLSADVCLIGLGSNLVLGPDHGRHGPAISIVHGLAGLESAGLRLLAVSGLWSSPAWPSGREAPDYVNAVALAASDGREPEALLDLLQTVEARCGRVRDPMDRWASRTLDVDLIDHGGRIMETPRLVLPHPRAAERDFVLAPLLQVLPDWCLPPQGPPGTELLAGLACTAAPMTMPLLQRLPDSQP